MSKNRKLLTIPIYANPKGSTTVDEVHALSAAVQASERLVAALQDRTSADGRALRQFGFVAILLCGADGVEHVETFARGQSCTVTPDGRDVVVTGDVGDVNCAAAIAYVQTLAGFAGWTVDALQALADGKRPPVIDQASIGEVTPEMRHWCGQAADEAVKRYRADRHATAAKDADEVELEDLIQLNGAVPLEGVDLA